MREIRKVCGHVLVVCTRCGEILWRGRIRRASSLVSIRAAKLRLLSGRRFVTGALAVFVELNYAVVHQDAPQLYPGKPAKKRRLE